MEEIIKDNTIIITNDKENIIKKISNENEMKSIKIITLNELLSSFYFDYNEEAIYFLMEKYNIKSDIAKIYIENMYYIDEPSDNNKINKLYDMKKELLDNNLLITNEYFKEFLNNKNIVLYNIGYIPNVLKKILGNYEYDIVNEENNDYKHTIYEFNSLDDEVVFVAYKIIELIKNGVDINNIFLSNLNDEYRLIIKRYFKMFNIPVNLKENFSIYNTNTCNKFLELYGSNIDETLKKLEEIIKPNEIDIYNKIIKICNKYVWCSDYMKVRDLIINDLKNTKISMPILENTIKEININQNISEDKYVFLLGFNQGIIPMIYKDEDYLSDKDKKILGIETSIEKNMNEKENLIKSVSNVKNLIITYKLKSLTDTFSISNINEELGFEVIRNSEINYNYSNLYNRLSLSKNLDLFNKYGTVTKELEILYNNYNNIGYREYDNKFKGINKVDLYKFLDNNLLLSYSSLDNYNRCNFRYYLNNILKLNIYEESFMQLIGNLFHYVLSKAFLPDFNYDECFDGYIDKELSKKEEFFIKKLKEELRFIIDTINEHNKHTSLDNELYEEKVYVNIEGNIKVTFMGIIDKLKYKQVDNKYIVAIIDYKTGNPNLNLNNVVYGIEMQLPIYIYLARNYKNFNEIEVAGFYLQKILNNEITADGKNDYTTLKKKNLLLQGYSNENTNILEYFDDSYADSSVVRGLKQSSKGFYAYSKVIDDITLNKLVDMTEEKIKESSKDILEAKFSINPKRIGKENLGCEFCTFKDICFRTEKDIQNLKEYKDLEFLGGEENA